MTYIYNGVEQQVKEVTIQQQEEKLTICLEDVAITIDKTDPQYEALKALAVIPTPTE